MSFFIRPELAARLQRWRMVLLWLAVAVFGGVLVMRALGPAGAGWAFIAGGVLILAGGALAADAALRLGLQARTPDAGVVLIRERRIGYMGPVEGGTVDLDALNRVEVHPAKPGPKWVFHADGQPPLVIPAGARGADGLADVMAALPGMDFGVARAALSRSSGPPVIVWRARAADVAPALDRAPAGD